MRYSSKCFKVCSQQNLDNFWYYDGEVYVIHSDMNIKAAFSILSMFCSLLVLMSFFLKKGIEILNELGKNSLANNTIIEIMLVLIGIVFYIVINKTVQHYNKKHIGKYAKVQMMPTVNWNLELKETVKLFIQCVLFFYVLPITVCLGVGFYLNWLGFFILFDFIACLVGFLSAGIAFPQRIKFQKKMIAETNNHLEPMVRS